MSNLWDDVAPLTSTHAERLGYPTQKPVALLSELSKPVSENDIVLDAFCGCGTALVAAQKLKRQWMGLIFPDGLQVMAKRLRDKNVAGCPENEDLWAIGRGLDDHELDRRENWRCAF